MKDFMVKSVEYFFKRKWTLLAVLLITPIGFYSKFYSGPLAEWVNNSLGGILYVVFWSLVFFLFLPKPSPIIIVPVVFVITSALEFLQLWKPPFLQVIRSYFLGATILGTSFVWSDLFYYLTGALLAYVLLRFLVKVDFSTV
jgi:hypothetical protein